jgi:hypothetical protein
MAAHREIGPAPMFAHGDEADIPQLSGWLHHAVAQMHRVVIVILGSGAGALSAIVIWLGVRGPILPPAVARKNG